MDALIERRGLSSVLRRMGTRSDLPRLLNAMDVFLHTAMWEGTPNVVLEAQQLCLPVVATDAGGSANAIADGVTGFCVPKNDEALLAERLCQVISGISVWREKAQAGPAFIRERFGLSRMVDETLAFQSATLQASRPLPQRIESGFLARLRRSFLERSIAAGGGA